MKIRACLWIFVVPFLGAILFPQYDARSETIELRLSHYMPVKLTLHKIMAKWAREVEERSNERIKITIFPGGALGKAPNQYDSAIKGIADITFGVQSYTPGRFPLTSVMELPLMIKSGQQSSAVLWDLYEKYLKEEYKDVKVLWLLCPNPGQIMTTRKQVKGMEDLRGMKLRTPGTVISETLKSLGATPVAMPITQVYTALQRGTVDGICISWIIMRTFRLYETVRYATLVDFYTQPMFLVMNKEKYNSLPDDLKKVIDETTGKKMSIAAARTNDETDAPSRKFCEEKGISIYTPPDRELENWKKATLPLKEKWVKEMEARGLPGKGVLEFVTENLQ